MHLNAEALVDIAEGTRPESAAPHLAACEACRAQLRELRAMMSAAQDVDVPEPSPLFWDHLSSRVSEAVAAEGDADARLPPARLWRFGVPRRSSRGMASSEGGKPSRYVVWQALGAVAACLLIAIALGSRLLAPAPVVSPPTVVTVSPQVSVADAGSGLELIRDISSDDDASLTVVASLTDGLDMETVREAGLAPRGSAEHAVTHMSEGELRELGRLLQEELARSGA
jgi:hypothetical protein